MTETHNDARLQKPYPQPQCSPCSPDNQPPIFLWPQSFLLSEISSLFTAVTSSLCIFFTYIHVMWLFYFLSEGLILAFNSPCTWQWPWILVILFLYLSAGIIGMHIFHVWFYAVLGTESRVFYKMSYIPYTQLLKNFIDLWFMKSTWPASMELINTNTWLYPCGSPQSRHSATPFPALYCQDLPCLSTKK